MAGNTPQNQPPRAAGAGFQLKKFPSEFEKSFTAGFDKLYMTILLVCLFVLTFFFGFMSANAVDFFGLSEHELAERTKNIIKKIYNVEEIEEVVEEQEEPSELEEKVEERKKEIEERKQEKPANKKESAADKIARRRAEADKRRQARSQARAKIQNSAQLALITGGASSSGEAVADVLGDANSDINLDQALSGTDGIAVASSTSARTRAIAGSRAAGQQDVSDLVSGVEGIQSTALDGRSSGIGFGDVELDEGGAGASGRSKDAVNAKLKSIQKAVQNCYRIEKRVNPNLKGTVKVQFDITTRGQVRNIRTPVNTVNSSKVTSCIQSKFRTLRFSSAKNNAKNVTITYIFN
jgi:outer membrane biosynthesis protein TonB